MSRNDIEVRIRIVDFPVKYLGHLLGEGKPNCCRDASEPFMNQGVIPGIRNPPHT